MTDLIDRVKLSHNTQFKKECDPTYKSDKRSIAFTEEVQQRYGISTTMVPKRGAQWKRSPSVVDEPKMRHAGGLDYFPTSGQLTQASAAGHGVTMQDKGAYFCVTPSNEPNNQLLRLYKTYSGHKHGRAK